MTIDPVILAMAKAIFEEPYCDDIDGRSHAVWRSEKGLAEAYAIDQANAAYRAMLAAGKPRNRDGEVGWWTIVKSGRLHYRPQAD